MRTRPPKACQAHPHPPPGPTSALPAPASGPAPPSASGPSSLHPDCWRPRLLRSPIVFAPGTRQSLSKTHHSRRSRTGQTRGRFSRDKGPGTGGYLRPKTHTRPSLTHTALAPTSTADERPVVTGPRGLHSHRPPGGPPEPQHCRLCGTGPPASIPGLSAGPAPSPPRVHGNRLVPPSPQVASQAIGRYRVGNTPRVPRL